ncbi:hypothetical protein ORV05_17165 [Amycolatopsis cynarae]|uniref:Uncharacterized protein n=1 Tax=Amycolatopsis cynarae TaxID=2995223 RepID=A0ABY7BAP1_9PSEU|nr:hypothetical protein [Amycolatopsis sp. HUAS 11-8]WAL69424.1 hypothetical protein ORV05_17165 [Amycolatopsis sp. HUAS 11-8]
METVRPTDSDVLETQREGSDGESLPEQRLWDDAEFEPTIVRGRE